MTRIRAQIFRDAYRQAQKERKMLDEMIEDARLHLNMHVYYQSVFDITHKKEEISLIQIDEIRKTVEY